MPIVFDVYIFQNMIKNIASALDPKAQYYVTTNKLNIVTILFFIIVSDIDLRLRLLSLTLAPSLNVKWSYQCRDVDYCFSFYL